jgi:CheY-like chemotaxis protein
MRTTKILIVDDHPVVIEGIKSALHLYSEFEVVGEAYDGCEAVECVKRLGGNGMNGFGKKPSNLTKRGFNPFAHDLFLAFVEIRGGSL